MNAKHMNQQSEFDQVFAKFKADLVPKIDRLIKAAFAAKRIPTIEERAAIYGFKVDEMRAFDDVAPYVVDYLSGNPFGDATLSGAVLSRLIDDGKIAGHSMTGDSLQQYSSSLASALGKLESRLEKRSTCPQLA